MVSVRANSRSVDVAEVIGSESETSPESLRRMVRYAPSRATRRRLFFSRAAESHFFWFFILVDSHKIRAVNTHV